MDPSPRYISISSPFIRQSALRNELVHMATECDWASEGIEAANEPTAQARLRGEPVTLTLLGVGSTALIVLLRGLLKILETHVKSSTEKKIVLVDGAGRRIEVPASTTPEDLHQYIDALKDLELERIELR